MKKLFLCLVLIAPGYIHAMEAMEGVQVQKTKQGIKRQREENGSKEKRQKGEQEQVIKVGQFIEIPNFMAKPNSIFSQGEIRHDRLYLDIEQVDPIRAESFKEILSEGPLVFGVVTTIVGGNRIYEVYSIDSIGNYIKQKGDRYAVPQRQFLSPKNRQMIVGEIELYLVTAFGKPVYYLGSDADISLMNQQGMLLTKMILAAQGDDKAQFAIGFHLHKMAPNLELAEIYYKLAGEKGNKMALIKLGNLYLFDMKKYDLAEETYRKAIEVDAYPRVSYIGLAEVYKRQGKYDLAEEYFKKAKEKGINVPDEIFEQLRKEAQKK